MTVRVGEPGGRAIARSVTLPIVPKGAAIGVKKLFRDGDLGNGQTANFEVIMATGDGKRLARARRQMDAVQGHVATTSGSSRTAAGTMRASRRPAVSPMARSRSAEAAGASIAAPGRMGQLPARRAPPTATRRPRPRVSFSVGYESDKTADTPDVLEVALDKAVLRRWREPAAPPLAALRRQGDARGHHRQGHDIRTIDIADGGTTASIPVKAEWGASAYLVALAHRPMDTAAKRLPGRAIGLSWFQIGKEQRTLGCRSRRAAAGAPALDAVASGQGHRARSRARRPSSRSRPSISASSTSPATRALTPASSSSASASSATTCATSTAI